VAALWLAAGTMSGGGADLEPVAPVTNGVAMAWDMHGRPWILETQREPGRDRETSRIVVLQAEGSPPAVWRRHVFAEGLPAATGLEWHPKGILLGAPPYLLFLDETNRDDRMDGARTVAGGFGAAGDRSVLRSFRWGPDGRLYFLYDGPEAAQFRPPGVGASTPGIRLNPGVLRYDPLHETVEAFCDGPGHASGQDFDAEGNLFVSSTAREALYFAPPLATLLPRDHYPRPIDGYAARVDPIGDRSLVRFGAGGLVFDPGGSLPDAYRGRGFLGITNPPGFLPLVLRARGAGYRAVLSLSEPGVPGLGGGMDMGSAGPDGALWFVGRRGLLRGIPSRGVAPAVARQVPSFEGGATEELVASLGHSNAWHRAMARRVLVERSDPASVDPVLALLRDGDTAVVRLEALWVAAGLRSRDRRWMSAGGEHRDPLVRAWTLRLRGEAASTEPDWMQTLALRARDADPRVRREVAVALRRSETAGSLDPARSAMPGMAAAALPVFENLLTASALDDDPTVNALVWGALEPLLLADLPAALQGLRKAGERAMPLSGDLLSRSIRRVFATRDPEGVRVALDFLQEVSVDAPQFCARGLEGMLLGQKGSKVWAGHKGIKRLLAKLQEGGNAELAQSAQQVDALCGNPKAQAAILGRIGNGSLPEGDRLKAILFTRVLPSDAGRGALIGVLTGTNSAALALPALSSLEEIGRPEDAEELLRHWSQVPAGARTPAIEALAGRSDWIPSLLAALESGQLPVSALSETALTSLRTAPSPRIQARLRAILSTPHARPGS
jgi:hypothetical protein